MGGSLSRNFKPSRWLTKTGWETPTLRIVTFCRRIPPAARLAFLAW